MTFYLIESLRLIYMHILVYWFDASSHVNESGHYNIWRPGYQLHDQAGTPFPPSTNGPLTSIEFNSHHIFYIDNQQNVTMLIWVDAAGCWKRDEPAAGQPKARRYDSGHNQIACLERDGELQLFYIADNGTIAQVWWHGGR